MKIRLFMTIAIGALTLAGCNKEELDNPVLNSETISATLADELPQTRTTLNDLQVVWDSNDAISIFAVNGETYSNNKGSINSGIGTTSATFEVVIDGTDKVVAVYPYMEGTTYSADGEISMTLHDNYTYIENGIGGAPMAALINNQSASIAFKNAGALMGITVNNIPAGYNKAILTSKVSIRQSTY